MNFIFWRPKTKCAPARDGFAGQDRRHCMYNQTVLVFIHHDSFHRIDAIAHFQGKSRYSHTSISQSLSPGGFDGFLHMPLYPYTDLQTISTPLLHASSLKGVVPSWGLSIQRPDAIPHHLEHRPYSRSWPVDDLRQALAARARAVPRQAQPAMRRAGPPDAQRRLD